MDINLEEITGYVSEELTTTCRSLRRKYGLKFSVPEIIILEYIVLALRARAPMELDEYLQVLSQEVKKGEFADGDTLNVFRHQLADSLTLNSVH